MIQNLKHLAVHNTKQFGKVETWVKMEELARGRLERKVEKEKARKQAEIDSLRRDMVAWKDQAEKMNVTRREVIQARRLFQAKAYRLQREALALGDEVQTALKKGNTPLSAELTSVQMLLEKTAKTAMSDSTRDEPEDSRTPPPEAPLAPPPPLPPPPQHTGNAPEVPKQPSRAEASGSGPKTRKETVGGPLKKPPHRDSAA